MTTFGIDICHFQAGLQLASVKHQGYQFVIAKATEGRSYRDPSFPSFRDQAKSAGLLFAAYHFLRSDVPIAEQAANLAHWIGDKSIPVAIDCEPTGAGWTSRPTLAHCSSFAHACKANGLDVTILYYPKFWWDQTGKPNLLGWNVWQALYGPNPHGLGSQVYPGDNSPRWGNVGGIAPAILQFGSNGRLDGFRGVVDVDAYRGDLQTLTARHWLTDWHAAPPAPKPPPVKPGKPGKPAKPAKHPAVYVTVQRWPRANSSLTDIAKRAHIGLGPLLKLNPQIHDANHIVPGQRIRVR